MRPSLDENTRSALHFTLLGLGSLMLGLVFVVPMLGHASWHAYRDTVDASGLVARASI